MGTTETEPETGVGYIKRVGHTASIVREVASDTAYGRRGGSLYPLFLLLGAAVLVMLLPIASLVPLLLLAVYIGGQR